MASIKKEKDKNGCPVYRVSVSNGRGRRISRTFRPEPTWSARTINRELQKFSADLEMQLFTFVGLSCFGQVINGVASQR